MTINLLPHLLRLRDGLNVRRYHTAPILGEQTVGHHSAGMALLALQLIDTPSRDLLAACLYHDLAEATVGDLPAPGKWRFQALHDALEEAESEIRAELGTVLTLNLEDTWWLRQLDLLELLFFAYEQRRLGNQNADALFTNGWRALENMTPAPAPIVQRVLRELGGAYAARSRPDEPPTRRATAVAAVAGHQDPGGEGEGVR